MIQKRYGNLWLSFCSFSLLLQLKKKLLKINYYSTSTILLLLLIYAFALENVAH